MATKKSAEKEVEITVKEKLEKLLAIQTIDCKIDEIERVKGELPEEIKREEDAIEGLRTRVNTISEEVSSLNRSIQAAKGDIEKSKIDIQRYESQKNLVRNDREYNSLENEIESASLDISINEKHIKIYNTKIKDYKKVIEDTNDEIASREKDLNTKKDALSVIESEKAEELEKLQAEKDVLKASYPDSRLYDAYTRIRSNARNGLAIVPIYNDSCGGCFNRIPPQRKIDIITAKKIIVCEYCGRILVAEDMEQ